MSVIIIKQTADYVVCVKPQGAESEHEMPALLKEQLGCEQVYPVHRLDKETGGLMVYALSQKEAAYLSRQVQEGKMQKTYLAVVAGTPEQPKDTWNDLLFRDKAKNKSYLVKRERKGVKKASLSYEMLGQAMWNNQPISLVKVHLHTGRTHQIRVQFSGRNHPLIGDRRYGGLPCETLALWATELSFFDQSQEQRVVVPPPNEGVWFLFENHNL